MAAAARGATLLAVLMALARPQAVLPGCTRLHSERAAAPRRADVAPRLSLRGGTGAGGGGAGGKRAGTAPGSGEEKPAAKRKRAGGGGGGGFFMPRPPPPRHGEKPIPQGTPTCLAGMQFVVTGAMCKRTHSSE
jgi:hypothetical protein